MRSRDVDPAGHVLAAAAALAILSYAVLGGSDIWVVITLFLGLNAGFGLRAVKAAYARNDDVCRAAHLRV